MSWNLRTRSLSVSLSLCFSLFLSLPLPHSHFLSFFLSFFLSLSLFSPSCSLYFILFPSLSLSLFLILSHTHAHIFLTRSITHSLDHSLTNSHTHTPHTPALTLENTYQDKFDGICSNLSSLPISSNGTSPLFCHVPPVLFIRFPLLYSFLPPVYRTSLMGLNATALLDFPPLFPFLFSYLMFTRTHVMCLNDTAFF